MNERIFSALLCLMLVSKGAVISQERGPVTNLPVPRFVSMRAAEANVRRGPSLTHRIDWVFKRRDMPVEITAEYGHWRRIRDHDGAGGWVHYSLLSGARTALVTQNMLALRARPEADAKLQAQLEAGVVARIEECQPSWCRLSVEGHQGWAEKTSFWGAKPGETFK